MLRKITMFAFAASLFGCSNMATGEGGDWASSSAAPKDQQPVAAGTLTAGTWDDNRNYELFRDYLGDTKALAGRLLFSDSEHDEAHETSLGAQAQKNLLDIALLIDTTGSMGDELSFLQVEFDALASSISERFPNAEQRWSLIVYRDENDAYTVNTHDFTDDLTDYQSTLKQQGYDGGGDYPEAPDAAFAAATQLSWREGSVARLAFWIADAPHHENHADAFATSIRDLAKRDVHIYPIAASGTDELTERTMRSAAQLSQGRYLFLTDDSGVGNSHKEPTIPCYFVTRLDHAIDRMIDIEMSGVYKEPAATQVIRSNGDPVDGICKLDDQTSAFVF